MWLSVVSLLLYIFTKISVSEQFNHILQICNLNCQPVSLVGRASDYCTGGLRFKPWPDQHSGS